MTAIEPNGEIGGTRYWVRGRDGLIGHAADADAIVAACDALRRAGCTRAFGPIEGSTWDAYRLVTSSDGKPVFPGEPTCDDVATWEAAGFEMAETYHSAVNERPRSLRRSARAVGSWRSPAITRAGW